MSDYNDVSVDLVPSTPTDLWHGSSRGYKHTLFRVKNRRTPFRASFRIVKLRQNGNSDRNGVYSA